MDETKKRLLLVKLLKQLNLKLFLKVNHRIKKNNFKCVLLLELEIQAAVIKITGIMLDSSSLIFFVKRKGCLLKLQNLIIIFLKGNFQVIPAL